MLNNLFMDEFFRLNFFDGAAGTAGSGDGAGAGEGASETGAMPVSTKGRASGKKSGEYDGVVFGKQDASAAPDDPNTVPAETHNSNEQTKPSEEDRKKAWKALINGEYKDIHTAEMQRVIDRRFAETETLKTQVQKSNQILDILSQRYGIESGNYDGLMQALEADDEWYANAADEQGMTVEQYKQFSKLQKQNEQLLAQQKQAQMEQQINAQVQAWNTQAEEVKQTYPDFDINSELNNPEFISLLKSNVPMKHAYEVLHMDDIKTGIAQQTAQQTEKKVVDGIRAKGARPAENGISSQSGFTVKDDPSKWSKKDRAEVARRVERGERITL